MFTEIAEGSLYDMGELKGRRFMWRILLIPVGLHLSINSAAMAAESRDGSPRNGATRGYADPVESLLGEFRPGEYGESQPPFWAGMTGRHQIAYCYRGDTPALNRFLDRCHQASAGSHGKVRSIGADVVVVLHAGSETVATPEFAGQQIREQRLQWKLELLTTDLVIRAESTSARRLVVIHVWIDDQIRLDMLVIPKEFRVQSGAEIEQFMERLRAASSADDAK